MKISVELNIKTFILLLEYYDNTKLQNFFFSEKMQLYENENWFLDFPFSHTLLQYSVE